MADPYQEFRGTAHDHQASAAKSFQKATAHKKIPAARDFYARQGREEMAMAREAHSEASANIFKHNNPDGNSNKLDLHQLHVGEAMEKLTDFLNRRTKESSQSAARRQVCVITGRGLKSAGNQARIRPTVKQYLRQHNFAFTEINAGEFEIKLGK